jgi:hypothetical protein
VILSLVRMKQIATEERIRSREGVDMHVGCGLSFIVRGYMPMVISVVTSTSPAVLQQPVT